jgi:phosphoribosylaminoimidazole-succinocarboxamide synthase
MTVAARKRPAKLTYQGSVKNVWQSPEGDDKLWFEYTDDYSVFDWGKMPDTIARKGASLACLGAFFFEAMAAPTFWQKLKTAPALKKFDQDWLAQRFEHSVYSGKDGLIQAGLPSHFLRLTDGSAGKLSLLQLEGRDHKKVYSEIHGETDGKTDGKTLGNDHGKKQEPLFLEVKEAKVGHPNRHTVLGKELYFYPTSSLVKDSTSGLALIPLEIVFRFGMPEGSSLKSRLIKNPAYLSELGLTEMPSEGQWFAHPVLEFFTKLETKDRLLSFQEASTMAGLTAEHFENMVELSLAIALALYVIFGDKGIELWDGKVEMLLDGRAKSAARSILLADSIGPDELRLLYKGQHLSKEIIRIYYRGSKWEKAVKESQEICQQKGIADWKEYCHKHYGLSPEPLSHSFKAAIDKLYCVLLNHVSGVTVFDECPDIDSFLLELKTALIRGGVK